MSLYLFVKLNYQSSTIILFVGIRHSMRDLLSDLNNYAWPANRRYASDTVNDISALSGISSPFQAVNSMSKRSFTWGFIKNIFYFHIFSFFFWFLNIILSDALILPISQLQTQQVMTSQIRSHIEYLIQTYRILVLIFQSKLMKNLAIMSAFNTIYWWLVIVAYFFGPPCR